MNKRTFSETETIYVSLKDEGVPVWRPVKAKRIQAEAFQIDPFLSVDESEVLEFNPGDVVRCEEKVFGDGGRGLVAVGLAGNVI